MSAYRGQTIKLRFRARYSPVGIDNVKIQQVFPGYNSGGVHARLVSGSDHFASLGSGSWNLLASGVTQPSGIPWYG